jgi:hypothetical protein
MNYLWKEQALVCARGASHIQSYSLWRHRIRTRTLVHSDLNPLFDQINQQYFEGRLSGVQVEWRTMDNRLGETEKLGEHDYRIGIDRRKNTSIAGVRDTLQHEACHVFVDWQEAEEHGAMFKNCMLRFSED